MNGNDTFVKRVNNTYVRPPGSGGGRDDGVCVYTLVCLKILPKDTAGLCKFENIIYNGQDGPEITHFSCHFLPIGAVMFPVSDA